jgi:hypothetical protein
MLDVWDDFIVTKKLVEGRSFIFKAHFNLNNKQTSAAQQIVCLGNIKAHGPNAGW